MDRLIAANSVALPGDVAPLTGTPQAATDGDPATNTQATVWPAYQYNAMQEELIAVIAAAGLAPDRTNNAQVVAAIKKLIQLSTQTFVTDTGVANAYVVAPSPALGARVVGQGFRVKWTHANAADGTDGGFGASTINDGLGVVALKTAVGNVLMAGEIQANSFSNVVWDGAAYRILESRARFSSFSSVSAALVVELDNGLIIQAFTVATSGQNTGVISYPMAFRLGAFGFWVNANEATASAATCFCSANGLTASTMRAQISTGAFSVEILAIGV